jgi:hypothetical protein
MHSCTNNTTGNIPKLIKTLLMQCLGTLNWNNNRMVWEVLFVKAGQKSCRKGRCLNGMHLPCHENLIPLQYFKNTKHLNQRPHYVLESPKLFNLEKNTRTQPIWSTSHSSNKSTSKPQENPTLHTLCNSSVVGKNEIKISFSISNHSSHTMVQVFTQHLPEMSARRYIWWWIAADDLTPSYEPTV